MRKISVLADNQYYARLLKLYGEGRVRVLSDGELRLAPADIIIQTGDKPSLGGGPSPFGFVMRGNDVIGSVRIAGRVRDGFLTV